MLLTSNWHPYLVIPFMFISVSLVSGGNILIHPLMGEGSHYIVATRLARELVSRGNSITMLIEDRLQEKLMSTNETEFKFEFYKSNFTLAENHEIFKNMTNAGLKGEFMEWMMSLLSTDHMPKVTSECDNMLSDVQLVTRLRNSNFDLAMVDSSDPCPIMQFLGGPYVVLSPIITLMSPVLFDNRIPFNPSYMPEMTTEFADKMSFVERLINTAYSVFMVYAMSAFADPFAEIKAQQDIPDASVYFNDAELWLVNTHFALDFPRPLPPHVVTVGGLTTRDPHPLSNEWEEFLQSAGDDGVVLFSMGSYATGIDEDVAAMFAGAFAQIPQKVIWKLNGKPSATVSPNVKVVEWIPQNDLLGHPQIKAFVYHCGMNGIWEAVYHGVPMVAVPLFGDQFDNAQRLVSRGMGVKVDISTLTSEELATAIRTVISDPSYKSNATRVSTIFRDTPRKPVEKAADWLEYVIRHGGAKHLRSAALDLNILQYLLVDVILTLLVACIVVIVIVICSCKLCFRGFRKVCGQSKKTKSE